ncbi:hypothetical protein [Nocardioides sp. Root151]|uniref:hypothetical protein n=1 Tax=Nocardioides sp. Root151 TaxID=1736475 RepID=UPI0007039394|nr:hypothetical protein [Nocardioides sp. Root151]KQZ67307.1 hypothetical protein ASD66_20305 [Nocardioides sp. Root151]
MTNGDEIAKRLADAEQARSERRTLRFDVWFDNFFSDLAVRDRIVDSTARVRGALAAVAGVGQEIERRRAAVAQGLAQCATERESQLGA